MRSLQLVLTLAISDSFLFVVNGKNLPFRAALSYLPTYLLPYMLFNESEFGHFRSIYCNFNALLWLYLLVLNVATAVSGPDCGHCYWSMTVTIQLGLGYALDMATTVWLLL